MSISPISNPAPALPLEAFARAAEHGDEVYVDTAGGKHQVLALGRTPSGRPVAWVAPDSDTASSFMRSLSHACGTTLSRTIGQELGLGSNPGKPLASRTITQALEMAEAARSVLAGVDFVTALAFSAQGGGAGFRAACAEAKVSPDAISPQRKASIDQDMARRFETAETNGLSPVTSATAHAWLLEILTDRPSQ
nr:hypothetical protein [Pseudomonas sp.]